MSETLHWDDEAAAYIRGRGTRYPGGQGVEPEWAQQVLHDADLAALEPDPKSRIGASRFIGHSPSAGRVLTVIAFRDSDGDLHLINAWPATRPDLKLYREEHHDGEDH